MALQNWDVVVHGRTYRVELDRNAETGRQFLRVDGRIALRPFGETRGEFPLEIGGKPFVLHVNDGHYRLEDKGSRYHDSAAARPEANLGQVTICRGLEQITMVTDQALLRIDRLAEGLKLAATAGMGGGLVGAIVTGAAIHATEKLTNQFGATTWNRRIQSFAELPSEVICRLEHLPFDLIALFSDQMDLETRVLVVPRSAVRAASVRRKLIVETAASVHKFEIANQAQQVLDHLCAAGYPLSEEDALRAAEPAREQRQAREAEPVAPPPPQTPKVQAVASVGPGEVRWTAPLVTTIGRDPELVAQEEEDAAAWTAVYPKTAIRRVRVEEPLRNLGRERYDVVSVAGVFDDKTRFREAGGFTISLKDLIVKLIEQRVKMLWLGSVNDANTARDVLQWAAAQNFFTVFTLARGPAHRVELEEALRRLEACELLSKTLPEIEQRSESRWRALGRGESIFRAR